MHRFLLKHVLSKFVSQNFFCRGAVRENQGGKLLNVRQLKFSLIATDYKSGRKKAAKMTITAKSIILVMEPQFTA